MGAGTATGINPKVILMPKLFDSSGAEIGREYYQMLNSIWEGQFFEFINGAKVIFAQRNDGVGFNRIWENVNGGLEAYESWRRTGDLPE